MHHGKRADDTEHNGSSWLTPNWKEEDTNKNTDGTVRIYDPPLADFECPDAFVKKMNDAKKKFSAIYTSPFRRCLETAVRIAKGVKCNNIIVDKTLSEDSSTNLEQFVGLDDTKLTERMTAVPDATTGTGVYTPNITFQGEYPTYGKKESRDPPFIISIRSALNDIISNNTTSTDSILVVTHRGVFSILAPSTDAIAIIPKYCGYATVPLKSNGNPDIIAGTNLENILGSRTDVQEGTKIGNMQNGKF